MSGTKTITTAVHCDSPQCLATGNAERIFLVSYEGGDDAQMHSVCCPYCHCEILIQLAGIRVWDVVPDSLLAS